MLTVRLLRYRQRRASHEGSGRWRSSDTGWFALLGIFDEIWKEFHFTRQLREPHRFRIAGYWVAIVAYLPQRDAETHSGQYFGRILSSRCPPRQIILFNRKNMSNQQSHLQRFWLVMIFLNFPNSLILNSCLVPFLCCAHLFVVGALLNNESQTDGRKIIPNPFKILSRN